MSQILQSTTNSVWNPCGNLDDHRFEIVGASGSYLECVSGQKLFDATSSWWCKSLGHGHPRLRKALINQLDKFEHVMLGRVKFDVIEKLSERLCSLGENLSKACFASDGACAVEQAMKLSLQYRKLTQSHRRAFATFKGDYHGDTFGALAVTDGVFRKEFESCLMDVHFIDGLPYIAGKHDPVWENCEFEWQAIERQLYDVADHLTAIIIEPIVQGAAGMKIYSPDLLRRLRLWCDANDVHLIADEIMTGLYRTGKCLAIDHVNIQADFVCMGKGLTSGMLPMSVALVSDRIVSTFRESKASFWHSHTFAGNALAASVALEVLDIMEEESIAQNVAKCEVKLRQHITHLAQKYNAHNVRVLGAIAAMDFETAAQAQDFSSKMLEQNILLRPIGNTVYFTPPLNWTGWF